MLFEIFKSFILGVVEGLTEWLPISSTGHMILVNEFLNLDVSQQFLDLFLVVIQIGAIAAVIIMYFHKLNPFSRTKTSVQRKRTWRLWGMVVVGCIPAAVVGIICNDWVQDHLYTAQIVAAMLIVYGIIFIVMERKNRQREAQMNTAIPRGRHVKNGAHASESLFKINSVDEIDPIHAFKIGLFQCLAIIPGTSRSGATIIGGMLTGCSRVAATEFTFFLAIPVMLGWGLVKVVRFFAHGLVMSQTEIWILVVGMVTAFVVSIISIKFLMNYIKRNDFTAFGVYRIVLGIIVLAYFGMQAIA